jgi:ribosome-binding factor A
MRPSRSVRLGQQLQREIALILQREFKDPRVGFVTITRVELSKDLRHAKVFFSCLGDAHQVARSQEGLDHATAFIRHLIKQRFRLKVIPEIVFRFDETIAGSIKLSETLEQLKGRPPAP